MTISRLINEHATFSATIAIAIIVGAFVWMVHGQGTIEPQYYYGYFYDLERNELYVDVRTHVPPVPAPSGSEHGVLAAVFSCGSCEDKSTHFVAWLERYSPEARDAMLDERTNPSAEPDPDSTRLLAEGHHIALPPEDGQPLQWLPASSADAARIMPKALRRCGEGARAQACNPVTEDLP